MTLRAVRTKLLSLLLSVGLVVLAAAPAEARRGDRLQTHRGVMTLGGRVGFELTHVNPEVGESFTAFTLDLSPSFGVFVVKNLLLSFDITTKLHLSGYPNVAESLWITRPPAKYEVAFRIGFQYLFNFRSIVVPYLGAGLGPGFLIPEGGGDTRVLLDFAIPAGILIAVNEHVGINIGTQLEILVGVSSNAKGTIIQLPVGYLGVSAFF